MFNYERDYGQENGETRTEPNMEGPSVIPRINSELFCERKELGICHRSTAFCDNRRDFGLADCCSGRRDQRSVRNRGLTAGIYLQPEQGCEIEMNSVSKLQLSCRPSCALPRSRQLSVGRPLWSLLARAQVLYQSAGITIVLGAISGRPEFHVRSDAGQTEKHTSS